MNEPYAVLQSGIAGLVFIAISGLCTCYTSIILRYCLYEENEHGKSVKIMYSYSEVGKKAFNSQFGDILINTLVLLEAILSGSYVILQAAVLINKCLDVEGFNVTTWMIICTIIVLQCAFLDSLKGVSRISLIGNIAQTILTAVVMLYCFANTQKWKWANLQPDIKVWPFIQSLTVILITFSSTYYGPITEANMRDVNKYNCMMVWTHIVATAVKILICAVVVLMWGTETKDTFTNNLPVLPYIFITNPVLAVRSLTNLPNPYFLSIAIVESAIAKYFNPKKDLNENTLLRQSVTETKTHPCYDEEGFLKTWCLAFRIFLILIMLLLALCIPFLEIMLGFLSCTSGIQLLIILPCLFHLRLKKDAVLIFKITNIICMFWGTALSILGLFANVKMMVHSH